MRVKTFILFQFIFQINAVTLTFCSSKNPKIHESRFSQKAVKLFSTLIIIRNVSSVETFLKDHVTLKTGVMMLNNQLCIRRINSILNYIKIQNFYLKF